MFPNLRISTAQQFVFHAILSLIVGAMASGLSAAGLAVSQPNVNLSIVVGAGVAAFSAWFVHGFVALRSSPQLVQAEKDTLAQGQERLAALESSHQNLVSDVRWLVQQVQQPTAHVAAAQGTQVARDFGLPDNTASMTVTSLGNLPQVPSAPHVQQVAFPTPTTAPQVPFTRNFNTGMVPTVQQ